MLTRERPNKESVWEAVIQQDKLDTMKVLLPLTPLFQAKIGSERMEYRWWIVKWDSKMDHKWIDSPKWAQRVFI